MSKYTKEKERLRAKGYATIQTNYGNLNVELHGDRVSMMCLPQWLSRAEMAIQAPKTVYNWIKLAKQGKYDNVIFHRLIPGFMVCPLYWPGMARTHALCSRYKVEIPPVPARVDLPTGDPTFETKRISKALSSTTRGVSWCVVALRYCGIVAELSLTCHSRWRIVDPTRTGESAMVMTRNPLMSVVLLFQEPILLHVPGHATSRRQTYSLWQIDR